MTAGLKALVRRIAGRPPDIVAAEHEIRGFVAALAELAMFARVGGRIARCAKDRPS